MWFFGSWKHGKLNCPLNWGKIRYFSFFLWTWRSGNWNFFNWNVNFFKTSYIFDIIWIKSSITLLSSFVFLFNFNNSPPSKNTITWKRSCIIKLQKQLQYFPTLYSNSKIKKFSLICSTKLTKWTHSGHKNDFPQKLFSLTLLRY